MPMIRDIVIRQLIDMDDLSATVDLQKAVWRMHDVEVSSPHTLRAIAHSGGAVIGAVARRHSHDRANEQLVGFCFGFGTLRDGELWLWSHMAGVHPDYQGQGIGLQLKLAQREWALSQGYRWMAWTFDPMQAGNANFNFNRLGVTARGYSVDHYGVMQDGINAGLASDRLEAQWELEALPPPPGPRSPLGPPAQRGAEIPKEGGGDSPFDNVDIINLVFVDEDGRLRRERPKSRSDEVFGIEIPANIAELKVTDFERAKQWQLYVRAAMTDLLDAGYIVSGFIRTGERGWYILSQTFPPAASPKHQRA